MGELKECPIDCMEWMWDEDPASVYPFGLDGPNYIAFSDYLRWIEYTSLGLY